MQKLIALLLFVLPHVVFGEKTNDEMQQILDRNDLTIDQKSDSLYSNAFNYIAEPEERLAHLNRLKPLIDSYHNDRLSFAWYRTLIKVKSELGADEEAIKGSRQLLIHAEKSEDPILLTEAHMSFYRVYTHAGFYDKARESAQKAIPFSEKTDKNWLKTECAYLLGYTFYAEGENDSAILYLNKAIRHNDKMPQEEYNVELRYLLGRTYLREKRLDEGIRELNRVEENHQYASPDYRSYYYAGACMYKSQAYALKNNMDSARTLFDECIERYKGQEERFTLQAYYYNASTYYSIGEYEEACRLLDFLDERNSVFDHQIAAYAYDKNNEPEKAMRHYDLALEEKDSIHEDYIKKLNLFLKESADADLAKQEELDQKQQLINEKEIANQATQKRTILWSVGVIGLLILIFGRMLLRRYRIIKSQKEEIIIQKLSVEEKNREILDSINYAKRIQSAILPSDSKIKTHLQKSFIIYLPKDIVAGDFYWMEAVDDITLFAVADCTGHGVPGAMVSVVCHNALNRAVKEFGLRDPGVILDKTKEIVVSEFEKSQENVQDGMDIALCALKGNTLQYAGAHNPLWVIKNGEKEILEIKANKQPIGKYLHSESFKTHTVNLNEGDTIYLFSDGYPDQFGGKDGKKFKTKNLKKLLVSLTDKAIPQQKESLITFFDQWKESLEQVDDVCFMGVKV